MTKEFTLRMPDEIHDLLWKLKDQFGVAITSKIMDYIARGLVKDGYYPIGNLIAKTSYRTPIAPSMIPEELKYCDGDSCEIPVRMEIKEDSETLKYKYGVIEK